jgi:hypothetical protein
MEQPVCQWLLTPVTRGERHGAQVYEGRSGAGVLASGQAAGAGGGGTVASQASKRSRRGGTRRWRRACPEAMRRAHAAAVQKNRMPGCAPAAAACRHAISMHATARGPGVDQGKVSYRWLSCSCTTSTVLMCCRLVTDLTLIWALRLY